MSITFADVPLLLQDPGGDLREWLDSYLPLEDLRLFGAAPTAYTEGRDRPRRHGLYHVGLPRFNWPQPPKVTPNTYYHPCTGATRFAFGLFLVDGKSLEKIIAAVGDTGSGTLSLTNDATSKGLDIAAYMLSPHKLSSIREVAGSGSETFTDETQLYLLPLVDQRYFWQWKDVGYLSVTDSTTWDSLIDTIQTQLGVDVLVTTPIETRYGRPDPTEFTRYYENAAVLLDAVAASLGRRVTVSPAGAVELSTPSDAATAYSAGIEGLAGQETPIPLAGDSNTLAESSRKPETIRVVFPRCSGGTPDASGGVYAIDCASRDEYAVAGRVKTFHSTACADFTGGVGVPLNDGDLRELARAVCCDYHRWHDHGVYDRTFAGLAYWDASGLDDYVLWHFGSIRPGGTEYEAYTRVASLPANVEVCEQLHQTNTTTSTTAAPTSTTSTTVAPGCSGTCRWVWSATNLTWTLTSDGCGEPTTTTSTSTTAGPTTTTSTTTSSTTTPDPYCNCGAATSNPTTTTTSTTSTTPTPSCGCNPPQYCGTFDGECTVTDCARYRPPPVYCGSSTTTTTAAPCTSTTSTTTSTAEPLGCSGCQWAAVPYEGGYVWRIIADNCWNYPVCSCPTPTDPATYCATATMECARSTTTTTTTLAPVCGGNCVWVYYTAVNEWYLANDGCARRNINDCGCEKPSRTGSNCEVASSPCRSQTLNNTTPDPCTTSTSTSSTSTTASCYNSHCRWQWTGTQWSQTSNPCPGTCPCQVPGFDGTENCQSAETPCGGGTTTTTTSTTVAPTTTTSTTSTTTTLPPCTDRTCCFDCVENTGGYYWAVRSHTCWNGCACCLTDLPECGSITYPVGSEYCKGCEVGPCAFSTTTTTTSTTGTPTTTTSSTSSTSSTSTTSTSSPPPTTTLPPGCTGNCVYNADIYVWFPAESDCALVDGCTCPDPVQPGPFSGRLTLPCGSSWPT